MKKQKVNEDEGKKVLEPIWFILYLAVLREQKIAWQMNDDL